MDAVKFLSEKSIGRCVFEDLTEAFIIGFGPSATPNFVECCCSAQKRQQWLYANR